LAIDDFSVALDLDQHHAATWDNRGLAHARLGHLEQAKSDFSQAVNVNPRYAHGYRHRAMVARLQGDEAQALEDERALVSIE
jgi:tetratricopeptide (TPR) repeat protein